MSPAVATSFDIAIWFLDRARGSDTYLQPRKLQCLLFLAQAHWAAAYGGRRLMPSVFVLDEGGPIDPNLYRAFENGRPQVAQIPLPDHVIAFLDAVWRRYHAADALRLDQLIAKRGSGEGVVQRRDGGEIGIGAMRRMFARDANRAPARPKVMRSHTGRAVTVQTWMPGRKSPAT